MNINKYDRQIRIWGSKGQKKLSQSKIALIGCQGVSIEAAKNITLPGVGQIDIFDNKILSEQDLSSSFFFDHESIGQLKGLVACRNLIEMNSDVKGVFYNRPVQQIILQGNQILKNYDIVICGNLLEDQNKKISEICWNLKIPVIFATIIGFFFHIRSQRQLHAVEYENTSSKKYYLRLHEPFSQLQNYASEKGLINLINQLKNTQNDEQIRQISSKINKIVYPVFLIEAYKIKKSLNNLSVQDIKDLLNEWKNLISESQRDSINQAIRRCFDLYQTPDNFLLKMDIFQEEKVLNAHQKDQFIFVFLKAVKKFFTLHRHLPQPVSLPDMHATTKDYLQLKNIYKVQHEKHKQQINNIIKSEYPQFNIDQQILSEYINNIQSLQIIKMRPYFEQISNPGVLKNCLNYKQQQKNLYIGLRTYKIYQNLYKNAPKLNDYSKMQEIANQICEKWQIVNFNQAFLKQICRYQGKTMISNNSIAGAVIAQQSIKLLTNCFTPMNNGYIFDGLLCKGFAVCF